MYYQDLSRANVFGKLVKVKGKSGWSLKSVSKNNILKETKRNKVLQKRLLKARSQCLAMRLSSPPNRPCSLNLEVLNYPENTTQLSAGSTATLGISTLDCSGRLTQTGLPLNITLQHVINDNTSSQELTLTTSNTSVTLDPLIIAGVHTLRVEIPNSTVSASTNITVIAGNFSEIAALDTLSSVDINKKFTIRIAAKDSYGNVATETNGSIRLSVLGDAALDISDATVELVQGISTFSNLALKSEGQANLRAELLTTSSQIDLPTITINSKHTTAFAWESDNTQGLSNIHPFYMVRDWNVFNENESLRNELANNPHTLAQNIKAALDQMPAGHKVISFLWDMFPLADDRRDAVRDSDGTVQGYTDGSNVFRPFISPWWDNAAIDSKRKVTALMSALKDIGAEIDYIVCDTETWINNWGIDVAAYTKYGANAQDNPDYATREAHRLALYTAIDQDPRMDQSDNPEFGFTETRTIRQQITNGNFIPDVSNWSANITKNDPVRRSTYLQFNEIMNNRSAQYKNYAVFDVAKQYFPNIKMSDYGYAYSGAQYEVPDVAGHDSYLYADSNHKIVGNVQSVPMYGAMPDLVYLYRWRGPGNWIRQEASPFAALRHDLNTARSAILTKPDAPFQPWIAPKSFNSGGVRISNSYYNEMIYHLALTVNEHFLFWNADVVANRQDNEILSNLLNEYDRILGYSVTRQAVLSSMISWTSNYIVSTQQGDAGKVSRLTLNLAEAEDISSSIVQEFPATVQVPGGETLVFENYRIERDPYSTKGIWLVEEQVSSSQF